MGNFNPEHSVKVCSNIKVSEDEVIHVSKGIFTHAAMKIFFSTIGAELSTYCLLT